LCRRRATNNLLGVQREITLGQALSWMLALAGGAAAFSWAFLLFVADREQRALPFTAGGLVLVVWAGIHLTDRQARRR
jgi:hypothetical protein